MKGKTQGRQHEIGKKWDVWESFPEAKNLKLKLKRGDNQAKWKGRTVSVKA